MWTRKQLNKAHATFTEFKRERDEAIKRAERAEAERDEARRALREAKKALRWESGRSMDTDLPNGIAVQDFDWEAMWIDFGPVSIRGELTSEGTVWNVFEWDPNHADRCPTKVYSDDGVCCCDDYATVVVDGWSQFDTAAEAIAAVAAMQDGGDDE